MAYDFIRYANQGATRNQPVSDQLASSLAFLPDIGVTAEVFSGGQAPKGSGGPRTGSTRHDHGNAADVRFYQGDRQLDWSNPDDLPIFTEIVRRGKEAGLTGFGAGPNYMSQGTMHVGFGSPGVWGAGGKSANAPEWLRTAYGAASDVGTGGTGQTMAYGGARDDTLGVEPIAPPTNPGGLGGLGGFQGFVNSEGFGDTLTALGRSLLESPSNAPLAGFGKAMESIQDRRVKEAYYADQRADRQEARAERQASMQSTIQLLMSRGMSRDEATALAANPSAATAALTFREADADRTRGNTTAEALRADHPDLADGIMSGAITGGEALKEAYARRREGNKAPTLQSIYTENGGEQRGYFNGSNEWVPVGGTKTPSGSGSGGSSLPSGYRWTDPTRPGVGMEPIPGSPGEQIGGENAGRIGIAKSFLEDLPGIRTEVAAGNATGLLDATLGRSGIASQGRLYSRIDAGVDALQRMLSGAGTPDAETARYARRYMATPTDTVETLTEKLNQLERELTNQMSIVTRGRGNVMGSAPQVPTTSRSASTLSDAELEAIANGR